MTTITKERIELFIKNPLDNGLTRGEQMELARIALASLEAEKVTLYRERNPYNGMTTGWQELTEQEYEFVKDNASENAEFRTVYTAPPAPVIQADVAQAIENLKQKSVECNRYNYCADAVKGVEDACLAAMRHGPEPVSQTYNLPELIEGMEVSIDVSTCDADLGNRYFGTVTEALELDTAKNGYILLVQDAEPNFDVNGSSPVTPDGWISCSERIPDDGQHVIILCDGAFVLYAQYRDGEFFDIVRNGDEFFETQSRNVTDWMPLPEPPQEVNRG